MKAVSWMTRVRDRAQRGFTMTELVGVLVMAGVLGAMAMPRVNETATSMAGVAVHDQVVSALRYAGQTAVSHRRLVCVTFTSTTVAMTIAEANPASECGTTPLTNAAGRSPYVQSPDADNAGMVITPIQTLYFQPNGTVTLDAAGATYGNYTIMVTNQNAISVIGMTAYVI
ncbi:type II secretion system GspH family protein [Burkholderiaceae bacterium DAT-1]|nr:type II secretion system GspH family protein [Burkholderiaceae bacterium DAT-1]